MKPLLIEIPEKHEGSIHVLNYVNPYFHNPIHFHITYELTLITQGEGIRITGDHVERFTKNDLVLMGKNLPHQWKSDIKTSISTSNQLAKAIVIHFKEDCFGSDFFKIPELRAIRGLLKRSKRGLKVTGHTNIEISRLMHNILSQTGVEKIQSFINVLDILSVSNDLTPLASDSYRILKNTSQIEKLDKIYEYILSNLYRKIPLTEIASKFHMSRTGFCRYFKTHTQKTFSRFILEARISLSCRLLQESNLGVAQIAFESGFNNLAFFNKEFKSIKGTTPLLYRKKIRQNVLPIKKPQN